MEKNPQKTREKTSHSAVTREAYLGKFQKEIRSAVISRSHLFTISPAQVPINAVDSMSRRNTRPKSTYRASIAKNRSRALIQSEHHPG